MNKSLLLHRLFKLIGRIHYFQTEYGIKAYNRPLFESRIKIQQKIIELNPAEIYLGFDGLNDQYTLVGTKISKSPHYDLVKRISKSKNIINCNYINREKLGSLDGRYGIKVSDKDIKTHITHYEASWKSINENTYSAVTVYYVDGRYYVIDGKHRLAMCLLLGKLVRCQVVDSVELAHDLYNIGLYKEMQKHSNSYKRNIEHMRSFMELRTGYPKILVVNRNKTDNLGDQAIGYSMVRLFESLGADVDLGEFSSAQGKKIIQLDLKVQKPVVSPEKIDNNFNWKRIKNFIRRKILINAFTQDLNWKLKNQNVFLPLRTNKYDYILIGGGELIQSNQVFPVALENWVKKTKRFQPRARIGIFSVGVTDVYSKNDFKHVRKALSEIDFAYVRDEVSAQNIEKFFGVQAEVIPDVVFSNTDNQDFISLNKKRSMILYGITSYSRVKRYGILANSEDEYFEKSYNEICSIKNHNPQSKVVLFFTTQSDYIACCAFAEYCKNKHDCVMEIEETDSLEKLLSVISNTKELHSPRMHGCIIGNLVGGKNFSDSFITENEEL